MGTIRKMKDRGAGTVFSPKIGDQLLRKGNRLVDVARKVAVVAKLREVSPFP